MTSTPTRLIVRPAMASVLLATVAALWAIGEKELYASATEITALRDMEGWMLLALIAAIPLLPYRKQVMRWRQAGAERNAPNGHASLGAGGEDSAFWREAETSGKALSGKIEGIDEVSSVLHARADPSSRARCLATASHELRQPLQAMKIFIDALSATPLSDEQRGMLGQVEQSHRSLGHLIGGLLDLSKADAGSIQPRPTLVDLHNVAWRLQAEVGALMESRNLAFRIFMPRRHLGLCTDPDLLLAILRNLLGNAAKYTERGGVLLAVRPRRHYLAIQVWDTGIGIETEHLPHLYTEFFRVADDGHSRIAKAARTDEAEGFGLGLAIAKRFAQLLDYELECRSRPGRGTVFEVRIPLAETARPADGNRA